MEVGRPGRHADGAGNVTVTVGATSGTGNDPAVVDLSAS
jgi:hypothetical protein